jgi:hypothetical protein
MTMCNRNESSSSWRLPWICTIDLYYLQIHRNEYLQYVQDIPQSS